MQILRSIRREQRKIKAQIAKLQRQLTALGAAAAAFGSIIVKKVGTKQPRRRRKLSAAGRLAISRAAKSRWARVKAGKKSA